MDLQTLGWDVQLESDFARLPRAAELHPGRVAREDRESYVVYAERRALRATVSGALRHRALQRADFPAVGDWVAVTPRTHESAATIHAVLPRRSSLARAAAGAPERQQLIAANVDLLLICCGLDLDFNPRRIERYLTLAWAGGVTPLVLLTKADQCADVELRCALVAALAPGVEALALSAVDGRGLEALGQRLAAGRTAALVGSSGVGKSTLINALLGQARLETAAVREHDHRGRHTTTFRELFLLPGGGLIIDTPGMRELQAWAGEEAVDRSFGDIDAFAQACRFRDCTHEREPGCGVRAALEDGRLDPGRWTSYRKQLAESRYLETRDDPAALAAQRKVWKARHKAAEEWMKRKYRM